MEPVPDPDATARLLRSRLGSGPVTLPVAGSSMRGVIASGATVHIHAADHPRPGEVWAFADDEGRILVHRVRHVDATTVTGRGTGNAFDDEPVPRARMIGRVHAADDAGDVRRFGRVDRMRAHVGLRARSLARRILDLTTR